MKTILALWNSGSKGKSTTVLELANLALVTYPNFRLIFSSKDHLNLTTDFRLIIEINGSIIAFESQGDPNTHLENRLLNIVNLYHPNIIICTTRTRGETIQAVDNIADEFEYQTIWTSTYQMVNNQNLANRIKAQHILDLLQQLQLLV